MNRKTEDRIPFISTKHGLQASKNINKQDSDESDDDYRKLRVVSSVCEQSNNLLSVVKPRVVE